MENQKKSVKFTRLALYEKISTFQRRNRIFSEYENETT